MGFSDDMKETCEMLAQSRSDRDKVMKELHSDHSRDRMARMATIKRVGGDVKRLFGDVHVMIQHFHTGRGKMSKEMREMLEASFEATKKQAGEILKESRAFLKGFRAEHKKMAEDLREMLESSFADTRKETKEIRKGAQTFVKESRAQYKKMAENLHEMLEGSAEKTQKEVRRFLKEAQTQRKEMSEKQQEEMESFCKGIRQEVGQMKKAVAQIRGGFQQAQKALHADFKKAHGYWLETAGHHKPRPAAQAKAQRSIGKEAKIMATLGDSSGGMTLKELSYAMGMPEKSLTRTLKTMRRKGHIRKKKGTFFTP